MLFKRLRDDEYPDRHVLSWRGRRFKGGWWLKAYCRIPGTKVVTHCHVEYLQAGTLGHKLHREGSPTQWCASFGFYLAPKPRSE